MAKKYVDKDKLAEFAQALHTKEKSIFATQDMVGSPLVAQTIAGMTDTTKVYVYTGSEVGMTAGDWYYYDGNDWQDGGVYNAVAVQTDTSLSYDGMAADAYVTGREIGKIDKCLEIKDSISPEWQKKTIHSDGSESNSETRLSTKNFIPEPRALVTITPANGMRFSIRQYTEADGDSIFDDTDWFLESKTFNFATGTYFKVVISHTDDSNMSLDEGDDLAITYSMYADKTLTLDGGAADAKVTGEKISVIDKDIDVVTNITEVQATWIQGNIDPDTGAGEHGVSRIHTTQYYYLPSNAVTISAPDGMKFGIRVYADAVYDSYIKAESSVGWYEGTHRFDIVPGRYLRFCAAYTDNSDILPEAGEDVSMVYKKAVCQEADLETIREVLDLVTNVATPNITWIQGNIDPDTGAGGHGVTRIHTTQYFYLESNAVTVSAPDDMKFGIRVYTDALWSTFLPEESSQTWYYGTVKFPVVRGRYVRFCAAYVDNSDILPAAGANVSLTYRKANMNVLDDVVARNDPDNMIVKLQQLNRPTRIASRQLAQPSLCLLHFSDIHGDARCLQNVCDFAENYSMWINDIIHTGDIMQTSGGPDPDFWTDIPEAGKILNCIGNHDTLLYEDWYGMTMPDAYDKYFAPYISSWGVTYQVNKTFYYKDYADEKVRLIVLDIMHQTTEQLTWFQNTLTSARTAGQHVMVALHGMSHWLFDSYNTPWDDKPLVPIYKNGFSYSDDPADPPKDTSSATSQDYPNYPWNISDAYATAVDAFIDAGGDFICWLHGHTHFKMLAKLHTHPRQLDVAVGEAGLPDYAWSYVWGRRPGTKSEDNFNLVAVDTYSKILRIAKVGVDYDRAMRHVDTVSYDYGTREIIWGA